MILEIVSPEAVLFKGTVTSVSVPGVDGEFQMLNNHAPIVSLLVEGRVKIVGSNIHIEPQFENKFEKIDNNSYYLPISSGTLELKDNKINILAN
ncbi:F0F1 ATP synthase subunit epsilon [Myroides ceti]|uniref:F0F1 ATP synthase subunit epsilon n=1 Tax=Paenimyroides ceti TaxID=395087 RepID=A0ABT8CVB6_9FLAO|nr:F0F1 ATP synthase subunit epsilon [Paenimyroides ceti]MDN3708454.1 F0F1 ATP synthase subunit epsilon [Paenimyroides ceti]